MQSWAEAPAQRLAESGGALAHKLWVRPEFGRPCAKLLRCWNDLLPVSISSSQERAGFVPGCAMWSRSHLKVRALEGLEIEINQDTSGGLNRN